MCGADCTSNLATIYLSDVAKSMFGSEYLSDIFREACCRKNLPGNSLLDVVDPTSFFS